MNIVARVTKTGGRDAATRCIPPKLALAVGMPTTPAPSGWRWSALTDLAKLESGHTPSRRHPEYWSGDIPWIGIVDARAHDGQRIFDTLEKTNELGIKNSSARILPTNTVCLSRTASVGYVVIMGRPMATSQDFVNWVCSEELDPDFLKYLFLAEDDGLLRFSSGAVHQTIYFPEAKGFYICHPPLPEQRRIVRILDEALGALATAKANAQNNRQNARALFKSHLQLVFTKPGKGWVKKELQEVADASCSLSYGIVQPGDEYPNGMPVVRPTDLTTKIVSLSGLKRIDPKLADGYKRTTLHGNELLLCVRGSTGIVSIAAPELVGANVTRGIVPIRFDPSIMLPEFGFYLLNSEPVQSQIREKTYGAALMQINIRDLRLISFVIPPLKEQAAIAAELDVLHEETQRLAAFYSRKCVALETLEKSLMHQAFTGKL